MRFIKNVVNKNLFFVVAEVVVVLSFFYVSISGVDVSAGHA